MSDNIIKASSMIEIAYSNIERSKVEENNNILKYWRIVVESIKSNSLNGENLGKNLAAHSRVIDLKNRILLVEADHPAWIQTLKIYQKYILMGLNRNIPFLQISSLAFRLRGTNNELHDIEKLENESKISENLQKKLNEEQNVFEKFEADKGEEEKPKEMPENLRKILDRLKNDMLTENH